MWCHVATITEGNRRWEGSLVPPATWLLQGPSRSQLSNSWFKYISSPPEIPSPLMSSVHLKEISTRQHEWVSTLCTPQIWTDTDIFCYTMVYCDKLWCIVTYCAIHYQDMFQGGGIVSLSPAGMLNLVDSTYSSTLSQIPWFLPIK